MNTSSPKKKKKPPKKLARRRNKNGIQGLLEAIVEFALAGLKVVKQSGPLLKKKKKKRHVLKKVVKSNGVKP